MEMEMNRVGGMMGGRGDPRGHHQQDSTAGRGPRCCRRLAGFLLSHAGLCALVLGYGALGAFAFRALEAPGEERRAEKVGKLRADTVRRLWEITDQLNVLYKENWTRQVSEEVAHFQKELLAAVREGYGGREGAAHQWSLSGAFLYSLTVITTIGYGNIAPRTNWGKVATVAYAVVGIPLMLLYLTSVGDLLARAFRCAYTRVCYACCCLSSHDKRRRHHNHAAPEDYRVHHIVAHHSPDRHHSHMNSDPDVRDKLHLPPEDEVRIEHLRDLDLDSEGLEPPVRIPVPLTLCLMVLAAYICGGAALFSLWEGWGFLDGSYFCFVTLSTIGFGDLVPGYSGVSDEGAQEKLVICSLYLLVGMALIAMCFNLMQEEVIHKIRNCGRRMGMIGDQEEEDDMG